MSLEYQKREVCKKCGAINSFKVYATKRVGLQKRQYRKCSACGATKTVIIKINISE